MCHECPCVRAGSPQKRLLYKPHAGPVGDQETTGVKHHEGMQPRAPALPEIPDKDPGPGEADF